MACGRHPTYERLTCGLHAPAQPLLPSFLMQQQTERPGSPSLLQLPLLVPAPGDRVAQQNETKLPVQQGEQAVCAMHALQVANEGARLPTQHVQQGGVELLPPGDGQL